ncbi:hypothetical protein ES703_95774 [subsurface metagenome]
MVGKIEDINWNAGEEDFRKLTERIGSLVTSFAGIEIEVINALALIINDNYLHIGFTIASYMTSSMTVDLFERLGLIDIKDAVARKELSIIVKKLRRAIKLRNDIVHSAWTYAIDIDNNLNGRLPFFQAKVRNKKNVPGFLSVESDPFTLLDEAELLVGEIYGLLQNFTTEYLT